MEKVRITEGHTSRWQPCRRMFVGDVELQNIRNIEMKIVPGEITQFDVSLVGEADVETFGEVKVSFDVDTIIGAILVLKKQLQNDMSFREAFESSVYSAIKDCEDKLCGRKMAAKIVSRLVGEE